MRSLDETFCRKNKGAIRMERSIVSIVKGGDTQTMVKQAVDHLGGVKSLIRPGSTVVIKPNAGHEGAPESSVNTSPEVVAAVIRLVKTANPGRIILAEASAIGCDTMACLERSGIKKAAEDAGVDEIRDIKSEKDLVKKTIENPTSDIKQVELPRFLLEADHLVNVPIFKSHVSMVFTCALKNLKGVVQDKHHYIMHCTNLAAAMMDLGDVVRPEFTVVDMIRPMEGFGPHSGTPVDFGCIVAGRDMVAIDATACRMVGLPLDKVEYFEAARDKGLGNFDESQIEIRGNSIEEVRRKLYLPYLEGFDAWPEYNFHIEKACSTCQGLLSFTMSKLKSLDQYDKNQGMHIVLGRHIRLPEGVEPGKDLLLMGDCSAALKKRIEKAGGTCLHVPGCPPGEPLPGWMIVDRGEVQASDTADVRRRQVEEEKRFKEWLEAQRRD
jgi:uncharacterized protein (DUF362 family)